MRASRCVACPARAASRSRTFGPRKLAGASRTVEGMRGRGTGRRQGRRSAWRRQGGPSPARARRGVLISVVAALAAFGLATGAAACGASRQVPSGRAARHRVAQGRLGPVVLIPGYGGGTSALDVLASDIRATGREAIVLRLPGTGTGSLVADAARLNAAVDRLLRRGTPPVDVIGYSAGGVVALIWVRRDGGAAKARRVITLGAPFHGTGLAAAALAFVPGECPAACRQLVPGSRLLTSLGTGSPAGLPAWLSLWTTDDTTVTPPASARLAGAVNVPVQSVCPAARITHSELPASPVITRIVLQDIGTAPLVPPRAAVCR